MKKDLNDGDAWFILRTGSGAMVASMGFSRLSALAESQHYKTSSALLQESLTNKSIIAWTSAPGMKAVRAEPFDLPFVLRLSKDERLAQGRLVVRQAHHDRVFPSVLSEVEGQAQGER